MKHNSPFYRAARNFSEVADNASRIALSWFGPRTHHSSTESSYAEVKTIAVFSALAVVSALAGFHLLYSGTLQYSETLSTLLITQSLHFLCCVSLLAVRNFVIKPKHTLSEIGLYVFISTPLILATMVFDLSLAHVLFWWATVSVVILLQRLINKDYSYAGHAFYISLCISILVGILWSVYFFSHLEISLMTRVLLLATSPLLLLSIPSGYLRMFEVYDVLCRDHWRRPRHAFPNRWLKYEPFVSIHVPTYSEPPEIVMATLDKLKAVEYDNYEVIVIDNNTKDSALWEPVKLYCEKLGSKFRFMHESEVSGAKGGALNLIHERIDPRASILAIIDADYQVEPYFLRSLVGYFQNPKVGFVQTPHDYRDWQNNSFLTMCYWEYRLFFHSAMIGLNERDAGITVGTMCLVRKEALEKAGGWSEWCVTEDSELAIRIHDAGYTSVYAGETYGRGLIPETFEDYKKQRYRWTAGPVQEFRHYLRHFIGVSGKPSRFGFFQRLFHLNHGLGNFLTAFNIPFLLIGLCVVTSMIIHNEIIPVPFELWLASTVTLVAAPLLTYLLYRVTLRARLSDILAQAIAAAALSHVIYLSAFQTALTGSASWTRTNKFKTNQSYLYALYSTKEELLFAGLILAFVITAWTLFPYSGLSAMLLIGLCYVVIAYLAAPFMALMSVYSKKHAEITKNAFVR